MNCTHADTLIQMGLDGRLSSDERLRLDAHIDCCSACRNAWDEHRLLTRTATKWARHPMLADDPGDAFTAQVMAQITARRTPASSYPAPRLAFAIFLLALTALSVWASPLLTLHLPTVSFPHPPLAWDPSPGAMSLQTLAYLPQDALDTWTALTTHPIAAPSWLWSVLAGTLALNVAFVWQARYSPRTEAAQ